MGVGVLLVAAGALLHRMLVRAWCGGSVQPHRASAAGVRGTVGCAKFLRGRRGPRVRGAGHGAGGRTQQRRAKGPTERREGEPPRGYLTFKGTREALDRASGDAMGGEVATAPASESRGCLPVCLLP